MSYIGTEEETIEVVPVFTPGPVPEESPAYSPVEEPVLVPSKGE